MFQLLKTLAVVIGFAVPVIAQWGTVVAQPDTNRFINSTQTYGLVMPHQDVIIGKLDTTITSVGIQGGNGSKVIVGSLLNYDDNCVGGKIVNGEWDCSGSYEAWREKEKSTSWYQAARGDTSKQFPTDYMITSSTGGDSSVVWNLNTGELWMAFKASAGPANMMSTTNGLRGQQFKDGILYFTDAEGNGFCRVDFLSDIGHQINTASRFTYNGNIQQRNDGLNHLVNMSGGIANQTVNAVAVVRDPFGLTDVNGAPKHWWGVATGSATQSTSYYNPHDNTIKNRAASIPPANSIAYSKTQIYYTYDGGVNDVLYLGRTPFAHYQNPEITNYNSASSGSHGLGWGNVQGSVISISEGKSVLGRNADLIRWGTDGGVYNLHTSTPNIYDLIGTAGSAKQRLSSTVNAPVEFGDAVALAFEDNTTDSSPYANTMTDAGSSGTIAGVFGNAYSSVANSGLESATGAEFAIGTGDASMMVWWKSNGTGNPAAGACLISFDNTGEAANDNYSIYVSHATTDGYLGVNFHDGSGQNQVSTTIDVADGEWHHFASTVDVSSTTGLKLYLDGVEVKSGTGQGRGDITTTQGVLGIYGNLANGTEGTYDTDTTDRRTRRDRERHRADTKCRVGLCRRSDCHDYESQDCPARCELGEDGALATLSQ